MSTIKGDREKFIKHQSKYKVCCFFHYLINGAVDECRNSLIKIDQTSIIRKEGEKLIMRKIYVGADHGGFRLKEEIKEYLEEKWGYEVVDLGAIIHDKRDDYPKFAREVAEAVAGEKGAMGILFCRSGAGMAIAANRVPGARAVVVFKPDYAKIVRLHNDANILVLGSDWTNEGQIEEIIKVFLTTEFSGEERHRRRLRQIKDLKCKV